MTLPLTPSAPRPIFERLEPRTHLSGADLIIESVTAPAAATFGATIEVSWVVRNAGSAEAAAEFGWGDAIYLSDDAVLDESDIFVGMGYAAEPGPLAAGASYAASALIALPLESWFIPGTRHLLVAADTDGAVEESDEQNNTSAPAAVELAVPALPDLVVDWVNVSGPAEFGGLLTLSWSIRNTGAGAAAAPEMLFDSVYISPDAEFANAIGLEIVESSPRPGEALVPGASFEARATVRLPLGASFTSGSYHFFVAADDYLGQVEENEENNHLASAAVAITQPPPPDLIVERVAAAPAGEFGGSVRLSWTVRNVGAGPAAAWWGDGIYLSSDATLDPSDLALNFASEAWGSVSPGGPGGTGVAILGAGESVVFEADVAMPAPGTLAPGAYHLIVRADEWQAVEETDEANNTGASDAVAIGVPVPIDLAVESGSAPTAGELGGEIEVSWLVRNIGPGAAAAANWYDGIYLSLDDEFGPEDVLIGTGDPMSAGAFSLGAGESYDAVATAFLPQDGSVLPGTYRVIVVADAGAQAYENSAANNALVLGSIEISGTVIPPDPGRGGPLFGFLETGATPGARGPDGGGGGAGDAKAGLGGQTPALFTPQRIPAAGTAFAPIGAAFADADPTREESILRRTPREPAALLRVKTGAPRPVVTLHPR